MNRPAPAQLGVHVELDGATVRAGRAFITERRGVVSTTFDYDTDYQRRPDAYPISPDLPLDASRHHVAGLPGGFADGAPDRWGRNLIRKRLLALARAAGGTPRSVAEVDYLLGVSDLSRQGALRYTTADGGPYLADEADVPKLLELPRLLAAADEVAAGGEDMAAVQVLLDAGSGSLGGARPKASVRAGRRLMIAKFPHHADEWDVMAWEKTALDLAAACGVDVPERRLVDVGGRSVLLLDRFDRARGARVGYVSAMTLLGAQDGGPADYLEVAEALGEHGARVRADLSQLWRRVAFSVAVNNTDDHLRNHGFLRARGGWVLSPAFDVNPEPDPARGRVTSIGFVNDPAGCRAALRDVVDAFRLTSERAEQIWTEVRRAVAGWRDVAERNGIPAAERDRFADALDRFVLAS
ncbi:type II toxin-antitoxin system HipA family toxin [Thalassiella azotivora]